MNSMTRHWTALSVMVGVFASLSVSPFALAQAPARPVLGAGEVTSNDVYVRCGASLNHYPICKLSAGDRVTVVGEDGDWYEVLAPDGTFSFISGDYVDTGDGRNGVVNGHNVRVRAGSTLPDFAKLKYAVQTQLSKGAAVTILGRDPDGFLRVKPPAGTTAWISRAFVELVPGATPRGEVDIDVTAKPSAAATTEDPVPPAAASSVPLPATSQFAGLPTTEHRSTLDKIDAATREELRKPVGERRFDPLLERYKAVAAQEEDDFAKRYAAARVEQLTSMASLVQTVAMMRTMGASVEAKRRAFLQGRANIRETLPPIPSALDAQGELRVSALYPPGSLPARYRLVDTSGAAERTIGYVEIPVGSTIKVDAYLGRYVGVRASSKRLQRGGVDAVPIFVAGDLTLLQAGTRSPATGGTGG